MYILFLFFFLFVCFFFFNDTATTEIYTLSLHDALPIFCYVRTDPTLPKHKGISLLIIDMDSPGIDIRPLRHISGTAGFAEVFFTDVIVPRENLVGHLNGGWTITQGSLAHER